MAKDPAFLFYSNDFLTGVADLTMEERGQYITLLSLQHQKGALTTKAIKIACPNLSEDVLEKFELDDDGNYFNERLRLEAKKRSEHSKKQKERAKKGWEKRKRESHGNATADATALPLEDENENKDEVLIKGKEKHRLIDWISENAPRVNKLKEPLSVEQCDKLINDFDKEYIRELLTSMHNYEPLLKNNRSANLTFRKWSNRDKNYEKWLSDKGRVKIKMNT